MGDILSSGLRRQNDRPSRTLARSAGEALVDALSDVLRAVRLTGAIFFDVQACEPWVAETPSGQTIVDAMFPGSEHLVATTSSRAGAVGRAFRASPQYVSQQATSSFCRTAI